MAETMVRLERCTGDSPDADLGLWTIALVLTPKAASRLAHALTLGGELEGL